MLFVRQVYTREGSDIECMTIGVNNGWATFLDDGVQVFLFLFLEIVAIISTFYLNINSPPIHASILAWYVGNFEGTLFI